MADSQARCCSVFSVQFVCSALSDRNNNRQAKGDYDPHPSRRRLGGLLETNQLENRTRDLPLICPNAMPLGYAVSKPSPLLKALVSRPPPEDRVATWKTKCESRQKDEAKQGPRMHAMLTAQVERHARPQIYQWV